MASLVDLLFLLWQKNKKSIALDILKLEQRYYLLSDDLLDIKMELDKIKCSILANNIFNHVISDNNLSDSDFDYNSNPIIKVKKKHHTRSKTKSKST